VFLELATLDGSIDGYSSGYGFKDDTLDFTQSDLIASVDPGGSGPIIVYQEETNGTTNPESVISGGFSNINRVLFASPAESEILIPPITIEEHNDEGDEYDQDLTLLVEREKRLIFNRIEVPIEDELIEELAKLGTYARNNTLEETLERLKSSAEFVQKIETNL
jgi:hypothetical protein